MTRGERIMRDRAWPLALRPLAVLLLPVMCVAVAWEAWKAWRLPRYRSERFRRGRRV